MSTLRLAWRNIWRNKRRTLLTAAAIALGVMALVVSLGLVDGMFDRIVLVATRGMVGHAQIHAVGYRKTQDVETVIPDVERVLADARATPGVRAATPRLFASGLIQVGDRSQGVRVIGADLQAERAVTNWSERLVSGAYPTEPRHVLIGRDLAKKLEAEVGTKLVVTLADLRTGEGNPELVRVSGILLTGDPGLDRQSAVLDIGLVRRLSGMPGAAHEIVLTVDAPVLDKAAVERVIAPLQRKGLDVAPWQDIARMITAALEMQDWFMGIFLLCVFGIMAFGIANTVGMSLVERMHEFGVLKAIGTTPLRLAALILTEAACLGAVGSAVGVALGLGFGHWLGRVGIDLGGTSSYGVTFTEPLYPRVEVLPALEVGVLFAALTALVALMSAIRAARIQPVEAMRA